MTFFLRNISITVLLLAIIVGSFSIYISGKAVYEEMLNQILDERIIVMKSLGGVALEGEILDQSQRERLQLAITDIGHNEPGLVSLRVVDTGTREILASIDSAEPGTISGAVLPVSKRGVVSLEIDKEQEGRPLLELSYLGTNNQLLWMVIDQSTFLNPALVAGVKQALLFAIAFGIFGITFALIIKKFFMLPVRQLKVVLSSMEEEQVREEKEEGETKEEEKKQKKIVIKEDFGELLESFSGVAKRIQSTIEHDKVISQSKSDFISTTAHQLRTPLSGINWAIGSLLSAGENLTREQRTLLERSLEKTKELVTIVGELLSAAGIEQGKFGFHREEVSIKEEIEKTIQEEQQMAQRNNATLQFEHDEGEFPSIYVDRERIRWVIRNLVENAIRYGKKQGNVIVSLTKDQKRITVSVKDDGIGISPDAQRHIFQKFFRSSEAKAKRNDGSGLGLFIVKNIINYHGGKIWFESVEGVGTTFFFTIPFSKSVAPEAKT